MVSKVIQPNNTDNIDKQGNTRVVSRQAMINLCNQTLCRLYTTSWVDTDMISVFNHIIDLVDKSSMSSKEKQQFHLYRENVLSRNKKRREDNCMQAQD